MRGRTGATAARLAAQRAGARGLFAPREGDIMQMHYVEPSEGRLGPARRLHEAGGSGALYPFSSLAAFAVSAGMQKSPTMGTEFSPTLLPKEGGIWDLN